MTHMGLNTVLDGGKRSGRRDFIRQTLMGLGAFNLPNILQLRAEAATRPKRTDTSLILLWQDGGPSHLDTFDPKPEAPAEIRGEFGAISTRLPGVQFCEILPRLAQMADKFSIIRSLHQASSAHESASQTFVTGYDRTGVVTDPSRHPDLTVVINRMRRGLDRSVLTAVEIKKGMHRGGHGYLGPMYDPFRVNGDPSKTEFRIENLILPESMGTQRLRRRANVLSRLDGLRRDLDTSGHIEAMDQFQQSAIELMTGAKTAQAFDVSREDPHLRARYGMHEAGQQCLLARRLVEAGVSVVAMRFVPDGRGTGGMPHWDDHAVHGHIFEIMKRRGPQFDQAVSALIEDLGNRGLDKQVLVVLAGEFGRTPRITYSNGNPGRNHWGAAGCALVYGGGMRMGQVIGATNRHGEHPIDRPVKPQELLATIYEFLGIDVRHEFTDTSGRPFPILPYGKPIRELVG